MNASYSINSITFGSGAGAFTLTSSGAAVLTLGGGGIVNNDDSLQTISFSSIIGLSASQIWSANTGALTVSSGIDNNGNLLTVNAAFQTILSGLISDVGGLTKTGSNTLILGGIAANTYSGTTSVSAGTLSYAGNNAIGSGAVSIDGSTAILNLATFNDSVGTVTVANGGSITGTTGVLTSTGTFEMQNGSVSAKLAGAGALNKTTGGTVTLSGENAYTGQTQVSGGKLTVTSTGRINGSSNVLISGGELNYNSVTTLAPGISFSGTGGKISGSGTIGSFTVTSGNKYSAGAGVAPGTQTTGAINFNAGSIFEWDIDVTSPSASTYDKVTASGAITGGSAVFKIVLAAGDSFAADFWNTNRTWTDIFGGAGAPSSLASIFSSISGDGITWTDNKGVVGNINPGGDGGYFTFSSTSLNWTAVPEPTSALAGLLLGAGLLRRRRI